MRPILTNSVLAAVFIACVAAAAHGLAALPEAMRGIGIGPVHTSDEVLFQILNGDFN